MERILEVLSAISIALSILMTVSGLLIMIWVGLDIGIKLVLSGLVLICLNLLTDAFFIL